MKSISENTPVSAMLYTWEALSRLCSSLLTGFMERRIEAAAIGEERSDGWSLHLGNTPLTQDELSRLMDALNADDYDRDVNDFGEYPIRELSQSLVRKLLDPTLPFEVEASHATDDGVWLTGKSPSAVIYFLVNYPETDCLPDLLAVPVKGDETKEAAVQAFRTAMQFKTPEEDRLERLDMAVSNMELSLHVKINVLSIADVGDV